MIRPRARYDMIDLYDSALMMHSALPAEPIDNTDANEPTLAMEQADPMEPIDNTESFEQILSREFSDRSDHFELAIALPAPIERRRT